MYVSMKEMLQHASVNNYAVPAPNCPSYALVKAACMAAAEKKSAVILDVSPRQMRMNATPEVWAPMVKAIAEPLNVPVALNLDHGGEFEDICRCIKAGFSSVMCDASALPFEENIRRVQQVVTFAHAHGVSVEAELGHVGNGSDANDFVNSDHYTDPNLAEEFVEGTGCGSLAIAVGNAHGPYVKVPNLDMERIKACREAVSVPLVMHGCSDIPDEQLQEAVNLGMSKFNIATEYFRSMYRAFEKDINSGKNDGNGIGLLMDAAPDMRAFVASKIQLLNPNHYSL